MPSPSDNLQQAPKPSLADLLCGSTVFVLADEVPQPYNTPFAPDDPFHPTHTPRPTSPAISARSEPAEILQDPTDSDEEQSEEAEEEQEDGYQAQASASSTTPQATPSTGVPSQLRTGIRRRRESSSESSDTETVVGRDSQEVSRRGDELGGPTTGNLPRPQRPRASRSKRQRLMNKEMRHDIDRHPPSSNGSNGSSNGASLSQIQKSKLAAINSPALSMKGRSTTHMNGDSPSSGSFKRHTSYFGHDRQEVSRLLIQSLHDLGYQESAQSLIRESGYEFESKSVAAFRSAVLQGQWLDAETILFGSPPSDPGGGVSITNGHASRFEGLLLADGVDKDDIKFRVRRQKYLELLEERNLAGALVVLRQELTPLHQDIGQLHILSRYAFEWLIANVINIAFSMYSTGGDQAESTQFDCLPVCRRCAITSLMGRGTWDVPYRASRRPFWSVYFLLCLNHIILTHDRSNISIGHDPRPQISKSIGPSKT